ncbi:N-acetyltransferase [Clostridium sp. AWRP]|uniref:GNAT family N-acetyltransferase n=1 Tax=Clostridium sp. AWRP TaxID=2212991 RepID=UPI000FDA6286|nr:N-acetyltransferase [Clostridium sp. AWRP]AZV58235.1 GNAT family N-acetyltransferase [Clostridium sp. AWRP]
MNVSIRLEEEKDYKTVEYMTREAFWNVYKPGCDEHLVVHNIKKVSAFIKELSFVAIDGGKIVGSIIYSKAKIVDDKNRKFEILCMGPISVRPSYQGLGIGSLLMNHSVEKAGQLGYKAIIIFGNPKYYHRFGFKNAKEYGIQTSSGENFEEFMVLELYKGALAGISGKFYADKVFEIKKKELEAFEKEFPYKEKLITDTQLNQKQ